MELNKVKTVEIHLNWIDYIKRLGIILVVIGHTTSIENT
jgi:fucose 4-O-acetylase-like acetyltransferase